MRFFHKLVIAASLFISLQSVAFTPESGFWWNPDEPGSGYSIEIQDNFLFVALYVYDVDGNPIWYTAGEALDGNSLFDGSLHYSFNGTCIDCSFTPAVTLFGERGPITIDFITETTATIRFQGAVKNIERFNFLLGSNTDRMLGEWQTVVDFSSTGSAFPYIGDVMLFDNTFLLDGEETVEGCRPENTIDGFCTNYAFNNNNVEAYFDHATTQLLITVDDGQLDGVDYVFDYYIDLGLDQFDGVVEYYPKNGPHNNVFYPVRGFRTASRSFVETGVGPSKAVTTSDKEAISMLSNLRVELPTKELSDYDLKQQTKIIRQREIFAKMRENQRLR